MAHTLVDLARALGWRSELFDGPEFTTAAVDRRAMVVVATQGHGDEDAVEQAVAGEPVYVGLVASRRRGESVLGYLAQRGVPADQLDRVRFPAGLDLGPTSHLEVAVAILAELVQLRAGGALVGSATAAPAPVEAVDPVCGMTVTAGPSAHPFAHQATTYYFCCTGCRLKFEKEPTAYVKEEAPC
jgi:xanthine dehydrogenase accessory factor